MSIHVLKDTKMSGLIALQKRLRVGGSVKVGVRKGPAEADGVSVAQVAAWTEFGTESRNGHPGQPERPFLRAGVRSGREQQLRLAASDLAKIAEGKMTMPAALNRLGMVTVASIQKGMTGPGFAPNAPSTIAKKGSSQPTIASGMLRQSVTYFVDDAGGAL